VGQARNESRLYRIGTHPHDNRDRTARFLGSNDRGGSSRDDDIDLKADELSHRVRDSVGLHVTRAGFQNQIFSFDVAQLSQSLPESFNESLFRGSGLENSDAVNPSRLLSLGRQAKR
jgi:hypothetical protein